MTPCNFNSNILLSKEDDETCKLCSGIHRALIGNNVTFSVADIIPKGLCPSAYFSVIPYWVSFRHDAWFRWSKDKSEVVCQCPQKNGVVLLVKKNLRDGNGIVLVEVISAGECQYGLKEKQIFSIENLRLCPALFPSLFSQLHEGGSAQRMEVQCCISGNPVIVYTQG